MEEGVGVKGCLEATLGQCFAHTMHIRVFSQFHISIPDVQSDLQSRAMILEWSLHPLVGEGGELPFQCEAWKAAHVHLLG